MLKLFITVLLWFSFSVSNAATYQVLEGSVTFDAVPAFSLPGVGSFTEGVFDGSASGCCPGVNDASSTSSGFGSIQLWGTPLFTYFAQTGEDGGIHNAPSLDLNTMTADMGAFYANWNSQEIYQGGIASVVDLGSGIYELSWSGVTSVEPKALASAAWTMQVTAVPVPGAIWLFSSGVFALLVAVRKKNVG